MTLDAQSALIVALVGIVVGAVGVALAVVAIFKLSRLQRSYDLLSVAEGRENWLDVLARTREEFAQVEDRMVGLETDLRGVHEELRVALKHVSVIRYDAFGDMGGRFSFSAALLDDNGDGLVITSIHGRTETRSYLKGLSQGTSDVDLSPEEVQAVRAARGGRE